MPGEVTIDVGLPDGRRTGPIPASMMRAALAVINKEPDPDQPAMFSSAETGEDRVQAVAQGQLKSIIERIERLENDKKQIGEDIKDVYAEAKGAGFDPVALRALVRLRKMDPTTREEAEAVLDLYKSALGMT